MKKSLVFVLAIALILSMAACGTSGTSSSKAASSAASSAASGSASSAKSSTAASSTASSSSAKSSQKADVVKIGLLYPQTGSNASSGQELTNCYKMGADFVNNKVTDLPGFPNGETEGIQSLGGAKVELVAADTQSNPEVAQTECERLINQEKCSVIIGCNNSSCVKTASVICEQYGVPFMTGDSSSPILTERGLTHMFQVGPTDASLIEYAYKWLKSLNDDKIKSVAIVADEGEWGSTFKTYAEKYAQQYGFKVAISFTYPSNTTDVTSEVLQIKNAKPDIIFQASYIAEAILFTQAYKQYDVNPYCLIASRGGFIETEFLQTTGTNSEDICCVEVWAKDASSANKNAVYFDNLAQKYISKGLNGNDCRALQTFFVAIDAIERAGSTKPEDITKALKATSISKDKLLMDWEGVKFNDQGNNTYANGIMTQIQGGAYVTIDPKIKTAVLPVPEWSKR
jgi:branched-chain amino acid transport system substrate-binding protein